MKSRMLKSNIQNYNDWTQKPHQDVKNREKDESSNSSDHEDYHPI
jgi:hypothetical protein